MASPEQLTINVDFSQVAEATKALEDLAAALERVGKLMTKPISLDLPPFIAAINAAAKDGHRIID